MKLQFLGAVKNANYYEVVWVHPNLYNTEPPVYKNHQITGLDCIDADGMVIIPQGPGLGIEFDWEFISKNSTGRIIVED